MRFLSALCLIFSAAPHAASFHIASNRPRRSSSLAWTSDRSEHMGDSDRQELQGLVDQLKLNVIEEEWRRPPNASCSPQALVEEILNALWDSDDPLPDSGFRLLLRTATKKWRAKMLRSIGAPTQEPLDWEVVASALGAAIGRPHNQFGLLVADMEEKKEGGAYSLDFELGDTLEYDDGTAWLQCRIRNKLTNELLVITGWSLRQRDDGAWLVDDLQWHDLRDEFRPGVGQTEWMRLCR